MYCNSVNSPEKKEQNKLEMLCPGQNFKPAELPDSCISQIHKFEQELNSHGYWNIALVAYQKIN